ncbi:hypothetical protein COV13_03010 [Candidatus Woesearchaeota archaeon CG10_big_fil_rev_8_21_14_0_10_32_9]|nr:MAG: hypothetical protein COV13_03010 [Candidatus Woesearchaeota archaeon CG10_big_fil_rev_8_21_14_0_10_32_9]
MNKKIMFLLLAIALVVLTIHSAIAAQIVPLSTNVTITSQPVTTATVGQAYSYQVVISNPNNEVVTYGLAQAPTGMQISSAGLVTWTPTTAGTNSVNISVTADAGVVYQTYTITSTALPASLTVGTLDLGSSTQERDEFILNQAWTLKNAGSYAITINSIQHTVSSRYNFSLSTTQLTLQPGEEKDILATLYVPEDENAGRTKIGQITLLGTTSNGQQIAVTKEVYLEVENNLVIDNVEVKVGSKKDTLTSSGTVDQTAEFDDEIIVTVEIKNTYSTDNADTQMRDITMELLSSDLDVADGLDDSLSRLDAGEKDDTMTVSFTLDPSDIDPNDAPFEFDVAVKGETRNGAQHGETWTLKLDMNVESKDLRIISATASPSTISCNDNRRVRIDTEIRNLGTRDLDAAMLRFIMDGYDVSAWEKDIQIDQGDSDDVTVYLDVPRSIPVGNYYVDIKAYPTTSTSTTTDTEAVLLTVAECQTVVTPPLNNTNTNTNNNVPLNNTYVPVQGTPVSSTSGSRTGLFGNDATYIVLLAVLVVLMFVAVLLLVFRMTKN